MSDRLLIIKSTNQPLEAVCQRVSEVAQKHSFGVLGTHDLKQKIESKGVILGRECRVFEVCNPRQAQAVLLRSMQIATALPCRIAIYEENGRTTVATIKPTALLNMFDTPDAASVARSVEDTMTKIVDDLVSGR